MTRASIGGLFAGLVLTVLVSGRVRAQEEGEGPPEEALTPAAEPTSSAAASVVLLAPDEVRAEWTAALQIELAPRGDRVIGAAPVEGATVLLRDAAAQQIAITSGARAAVRVEGTTLRVIAVDAERARATPYAAEADARTVALILASLLDEREPLGVVPPPPPAAPPTAAPAPPASVASTTGDAPIEDEAPPALDDVGDEAGASPWPQFSFRLGTGGFGLVNDRRFIGGGVLRLGMGLRARYFEGALLLDGGLMLDTLSNVGSELQPLGRSCIEAGAAIPTGDAIALHFGGRGCVGFAELRVVDFFDPFFAADQMGWLFSAGGYVAISFALSDWSRIYVRADVEGALLESSMHRGEVFPVLSTILSFF